MPGENLVNGVGLSLSARRAWIEISGISCKAAEIAVALRKESVDRNAENPMIRVDEIVALRKESVDRNVNCNSNFTQKKQSLSARRAWIEITLVQIIISGYARSLSARRAWIEIDAPSSAPYAELSRSPQGERG